MQKCSQCPSLCTYRDAESDKNASRHRSLAAQEDHVAKGKIWPCATQGLHHLKELNSLRLSTVALISAAITACGTAGGDRKWSAARELLSDARQTFVRCNIIVTNAAISCFEHCQAWQQSISMLASAQAEDLRPDTITYNTAIRIAQHKTWPWSQACFLLCDLRELALKGDLISRNTALTVCRGAWQEALVIHAEIQHYGLEADVVTCAATISLCEGLRWTLGLSLVKCLVLKQIRGNTVVYNSAMTSTQRAEDPGHALGLFESLRPQTLRPSLVSCNAVLSAFEKSQSKWKESLAFLRNCLRTSFRLDVISCNSVISAVEKSGRWQEAFCVFNTMDAVDIGHDVVSCSAVISACEKPNIWQSVLRFLAKIEGSSLEAHTISFNAAISACGSQEWQQALLLLRSMRHKSLQVTVASLNTAISACDKGANWKQALALLAWLYEIGVKPDAITYNAAASACEKCSRWIAALQLCKALPKVQIPPTTITFNTAMAACGKAGHLRLCLQLLADLVLQRLEADVVTYSTAISACDPQDWQTALSLLGQMEHTGLEINLVCYSAALQACGRSTQWQRGLILYSRFERSQPVLRFDVVPLSAVLESLESSRQQLLLVQLLPRVEMMCYQGMQ
ncbi:unnamed protein product [Symbiodinium microadriaticum]|nr:unnamed protein product [Symbiodinium microadriaticum]